MSLPLLALSVPLCLGAAVPLRAQCPDGTPPPCRTVARPAATNSVAVLYFDNLSRDSNDLYLADGLTEEVISRLAGIERLTVRSRHAVQRYRGAGAIDPTAVGRALNVAYLVTGSVRRAGERLRVSAGLVNVRDGAQVWGRQFDQSGGDVFAIQEAVAEGVATGIVGRLVPAEREVLGARATRSVSAYDAWLRGNFLLARRDSVGLTRAIRAYSAAFEADTTFSDALSRIALAYGIAEGNGYGLGQVPAESLTAFAMRFATEAVRRAPQSAEAWISMALARKAADPRRLTGAREASERAVALAPDNAEAHHQLAVTLAWLGDSVAAEAHGHRALALEPSRPVTINNMGMFAARRGRWDEMVRWADSALAVDPDFAFAHYSRLVGLLQAGAAAQARDELARWPAIPSLRILAPPLEPLLRTSPSDTAAIRTYRDSVIGPRRRLAPALAAHWAQVLLLTTRDRDGALSLLERAYPRGAQLRFYLGLPALGPIRADPRFQRLLADASP